MPQEPPPQEPRLEELLPDGKYVRYFKQLGENTRHLFLQLQLPGRFGNYDALQKLLVEKGMPIDRIRTGVLSASKRVFQGKAAEVGSYKLTITSPDKHSEWLELTLDRENRCLGRAVELFNVLKEYIAMYEQTQQKPQ